MYELTLLEICLVMSAVVLLGNFYLDFGCLNIVYFMIGSLLLLTEYDLNLVRIY